MTSNEREQVLKMIADGKISAEEGLKLMNILDKEAPEDENPSPKVASGPQAPPPPAEHSNMENDPRIMNIKSIVHRFWQIPLWIGIVILLGSSLGMYALIQAGHMNFWFYFLILPLLTGVLLVAIAAGSRQARWLFVDVQKRSGEKPHRIFLGFPLPMRFAAWFFRTFGSRIDGLKKTNVDEIIQIVEAGISDDSPLIVNVDEGDDGERVRVYIG